MSAETTTFWTIGNLLGLVIGAGILTALIVIGKKLQVLDDLVKTTDKMKKNLKVVSDFLIGSELPFDHEKLQAYSPVQLTDKGSAYLETVGFIKIFDENKVAFFSCIDGEQPQTDFDIENAATASVIQLFNESYFDVVKNHFYQNPAEDKFAFYKIAGVYVRNAYMEHVAKKVVPAEPVS